MDDGQSWTTRLRRDNGRHVAILVSSPGCVCASLRSFASRYDTCDVGTFPNQTDADHLGPAAALHSDASKDIYNFELSWLTGQRLSSCTCANEDHPGPSVSKGRGAPEIDVLEAEHNKQGAGGVISQSAQFAPFTHDYLYLNDTDDKWKVYNPAITYPNNYQ